jgi:hypothetical protein
MKKYLANTTLNSTAITVITLFFTFVLIPSVESNENGGGKVQKPFSASSSKLSLEVGFL